MNVRVNGTGHGYSDFFGQNLMQCNVPKSKVSPRL